MVQPFFFCASNHSIEPGCRAEMCMHDVDKLSIPVISSQGGEALLDLMLVVGKLEVHRVYMRWRSRRRYTIGF